MPQSAPSKVINYFEGYWDAPLTVELVGRIAGWSDKELDRFYGGWPPDVANPNALWDELPELARGQVRPIVGSAFSPTTEMEVVVMQAAARARG